MIFLFHLLIDFLLYIQPFSVDSEKPDYDMDSDDEIFLEVKWL